MDRRSFVAALAAAAGSVRAQSAFPTRPITLIAPSVPGGSTDVICRALAESVSRRLGVAVLVENKAGAGGALGGMALAGAKPDGYLVALLPLAVFRVALMQKTTFDPLRDIAYVAGLGGFVFGIAVPANAPWRNLPDLLADARKHPAAISYGHAGVGTTPHLAVEELALKTGVEFTAVPYKGSNEALLALLSGQVQMNFSLLPIARRVDRRVVTATTAGISSRLALAEHLSPTARPGKHAAAGRRSGQWRAAVRPAGRAHRPNRERGRAPPSRARSRRLP